jgi:hypothetical protein
MLGLKRVVSAVSGGLWLTRSGGLRTRLDQLDRQAAAPHHEFSLTAGVARIWACRAMLTVVPVLLVFFLYTRPVLRHGVEMPPFLKSSSEWQLTPDFGFYVYQLKRSCDVGGAMVEGSR